MIISVQSEEERRVVIAMAKILDADIITTDTDAIEKIDPSVHVISLGKTIKFPPLKQISASIKFYSCDFSKEYDFFIFTGNWAIMQHTGITQTCGIVIHRSEHFMICILHFFHDRILSPGNFSGAGFFFTVGLTRDR